ncbi:hypothetical protein [Kribbella sp. CA-293567]|uniref:hypothetical protein n=1 Tax=Kribbella sp. CA-293567 TaxID=3002436 RepID=UPI0022DD63EC|nr:hypothetical protein [Kribbella sp. CA-293567]WBQ04382.1 hypothetical protein OX958_31015 [Kribbella sp. CA-293567]
MRRSDQLRRLAVRYVENGWPVARLAVPFSGACPCGLSCAEPHLVQRNLEMITTSREAADAFAEGRWAIALATHGFDVLEIPAPFGAPLHHQLKDSCPTALAPATRTWQFYLAPGSVAAALAEASGGRLKAGPGDWIPAPGTTSEGTGTIRWLVHPYLTNWRPYRRHDAIDRVFSTVDWSASEAPSTLPPTIVDGLLD